MADEARWTPWGRGWTAPNGKSPEHQYMRFVEAFVELARPYLVVETGAGSGRVTRRIADRLEAIDTVVDEVGGRLVAFESDDGWRGLVKADLEEHGYGQVADEPTPAAFDFEQCSLAVLDSATGYRIRELELWAANAPAGSYALVHDVSHRHRLEEHGSGIHWRLAYAVDAMVEVWHLERVQLPNPRGAVLLRKA